MSDYEARLAVAMKVCGKWLKRAPIWRGTEQELLAEGQDDRTHWAGMRPRAEMLKVWIEEFDSFVAECAPAALPYGYDKGRVRFRTGMDMSEVKSVRRIPHENVFTKGNSDGDFYEWYTGSVYRMDRSGSLIVVRWKFDRQGSWG
ncbi:hypothetical protein GCM10018790_64410 [Kitasatospora xanthocidica]|uniref:hypothetical protein n=1 Tax=Kitasatospora xanthocidica TaxID=83382 RepID=UPI0016774BA4|nr:hypothetical protein [Kitasatospora xanthocidica]GHF77415.1 hypothetical protein GCM10018790_64410 [Kitasatospora xanthocidica]